MALAHILKYRKPPRKVFYHGVTYDSINAFVKAAREAGYKVNFGSVRYALDHGRDLDEVLAGKKFARKSQNGPIVYNGMTFESIAEFGRYLAKTGKPHVTLETFRKVLKTEGVEAAVKRFRETRITKSYLSKRLGGKHNLITLRMHYGWSYDRASTEPCHKKHKRALHNSMRNA